VTIRRTDFDSGLCVVTERMAGVRSAAVGLWVRAGSRDEPPRISGSSHFLEHLLFKGTRSRTARDIAEAFDAVGGDLNAFTAKEYTCFYARVLDRDVPMAIDHLADMYQHSRIRSSDLDAERQVILEEIHMHDDAPDEVVHDLFTEVLWPDHPLGRPILGTVETIEAASREAVRRFYARHYVPGNLVVAAAGNVDHEALVGQLTSLMDAGSVVEAVPGRSNSHALRAEPKPSGRELVRRRKTEQAHIVVGTNAVSRADDDRFAFLIVNTALGGGMSSRLFQEVREKRGLAYSVFSYQYQFAEAGQFAAYAGTTPGQAAEVLRLMRREIDDVAAGGLREDEFERAKGHVKGSLVLSLEDPGGRMSRLGKSEVSHGEVLSVDQTIERIETVDLAHARAVAHRVLSQPMTLTVLGPFGARAFAGVA
jgi:predicted Zn-dependent peptidase